VNTVNTVNNCLLYVCLRSVRDIKLCLTVYVTPNCIEHLANPIRQTSCTFDDVFV